MPQSAKQDKEKREFVMNPKTITSQLFVSLLLRLAKDD